MTTAALPLPRIQHPVLVVAGFITVGLGLKLLADDGVMALLLLIGVGLGVALYHASFGFAGAYRKAIVDKDISGVAAQLLMLGTAILLFAPILSQGEAFGHNVGGAFAPVSVSMALGAFVFGIGMQFAGCCASGTLFVAGGGNSRMTVVLVFFCIGTFIGSLHLGWWTELPGIGSISLRKEFGWERAIPLQLGVLALVYFALRLSGATIKQPIWWTGDFSLARLLRGPWPLVLSAGVLAVLNWATLVVAGHPWSITWAFTLWGAKGASLLGWQPNGNWFWTGGYSERALDAPILNDTTSVMCIGIVLGAMMAASLAGKIAPKRSIPLPALASAIVGGIIMGYGARLAYGCNIGAFFSGVASGSLHGWVCILCAIPGNWVGIKLRPIFRENAPNGSS